MASEAAHEWLERYLEAAEGPTDFVLTGPATNLNWALQRRPHLASKVGRVFWMAGAVDVDGNIRDSDDDKPQERGVGARVQGGHLYISSSSIYEILRNEALFTNSHLGQSVRGIQSSNKDPMVHRGRSAALKSSRLYGKLRCQALCLLRTAMAQPNGMHSGTQRERRSCCVWGWICGWRLAIMGILLNCVFLSSESWIRHPFVCFLSSLSHGLTIEGHHIVDTQFSSIFHTPVDLGFSIGSLHLGVPHMGYRAYSQPLFSTSVSHGDAQVPLDATNAVPVRKDFIQRLDPTKQVSRTAQQIWAQSKFQKSALEMLEYME